MEVGAPRIPRTASKKVPHEKTLVPHAGLDRNVHVAPVGGPRRCRRRQPLAAGAGDPAIVVPHGRPHPGDVQRVTSHRHQPTHLEPRHRAEAQRPVQQQDQDQHGHQPARLRAVLALCRAERPAARPGGEAQAGEIRALAELPGVLGQDWRRPTASSKTVIELADRDHAGPRRASGPHPGRHGRRLVGLRSRLDQEVRRGSPGNHAGNPQFVEHRADERRAPQQAQGGSGAAPPAQAGRQVAGRTEGREGQGAGRRSTASW